MWSTDVDDIWSFETFSWSFRHCAKLLVLWGVLKNPQHYIYTKIIHQYLHKNQHNNEIVKLEYYSKACQGGWQEATSNNEGATEIHCLRSRCDNDLLLSLYYVTGKKLFLPANISQILAVLFYGMMKSDLSFFWLQFVKSNTKRMLNITKTLCSRVN